MCNLPFNNRDFSIRNGGLSLLCAEVAVDINNLSRGIQEETQELDNLTSLLKNYVSAHKEENFLDEESFVLINSFLKQEKHKGAIGYSPDQFLLDLNLLLNDLRDVRKIRPEQQESLASFCVQLSKEVRNYQSTYFSRRSLAA